MLQIVSEIILKITPKSSEKRHCILLYKAKTIHLICTQQAERNSVSGIAREYLFYFHSEFVWLELKTSQLDVQFKQFAEPVKCIK